MDRLKGGTRKRKNTPYKLGENHDEKKQIIDLKNFCQIVNMVENGVKIKLLVEIFD